MTSLSGNLPKGDGNGLTAIVDELIKDPRQMHIVIAIVDCAKVTQNTDTGETIPTARIRRIEVCKGEDASLAENLMRRALDQRTGREALPYDLEEELRGVVDAPWPDRENLDESEDEDTD